MNTEEGNKLIATFMNHGGGANDEYNNKPMEYNSDWNYIMKVIDKIEDADGSIHINSGDVFLHFPERLSPMVRVSYEKNGTTKINAVWQAVIHFITWYNAQSPKK